MGWFRKKKTLKTYDKDNKKPIIKASICNGEQVAGFKDIHTGKMEEVMLIKKHPGKSAEVTLSPNNYDYGKWVAEIIETLGYEKISCFGGSFGAGIIAKTMCVVPHKMEKVVLYVPSGISNAPSLSSMSMMIPMVMYWITHRDKWLRKCMLPMAVIEENITDDIYETAKMSIDFSKVKTGMPRK